MEIKRLLQIMIGQKVPANNNLFIPKAVVINGNIQCDEYATARIEGVVNGSIASKNKVIVAATALVNGGIECTEAIIEGAVDGSVVATTSALIAKKASVGGNIISNALTISPESQVGGQIRKVALGTTIDDIKKAFEDRNNSILEESSSMSEVLRQHSNESLANATIFESKPQPKNVREWSW